MTGCPSDLKLEMHLLDPARSGVGEHVAGCQRCKDELAQMDKEGQHFHKFVYPATLEAVSAPRRRRWANWLLISLAPVAAAAAVLLAVRTQPPSDYSGTKGGGLHLEPFIATASGPRAVSDGEAIPAASALRFRVRSSEACALWIISVDGAGTVSRLYPPQGPSGASIRGEVTTPGGVRLDGKAGPERFFAVCARNDPGFARVEEAARVVAGGGASVVRKTGALPGLSPETAQSSVLVEKAP
jgi:hypothetical protein